MNVPSLASGPTATDTGEVVFAVLVDGESFRGTLSPLGIGGPSNVSLERCGAVMRAVDEYVRSHRAAAHTLLLDAARRRRAAGNPPPLGAPAPLSEARFVQEPRAVRRAVAAEVAVQGVVLRVVVSPDDGGILDDHENWSGVTPEHRRAAMQMVIDYLCTNAARAAALGVDAALIDLLWR